MTFDASITMTRCIESGGGGFTVDIYGVIARDWSQLELAEHEGVLGADVN